MKKSLLIVFLCSFYGLLQSAIVGSTSIPSLTEAEKIELQQQERNTDLVILNDFSELKYGKKASIALRRETQKALKDQNVVLASKSIFLATQKEFGSTEINGLMENYTCKEADGDYLLLIPKKMQDETKSKDYQDAFVGFSYNKLADFDYTNISKDEANILSRGNALDATPAAGESLLNIFNNLKIKNVAKEEQPFINIYLSGHGNKNLIAGIRFDSEKKSNNLLKLVKFFNESIRTKSLSLATCFIGGSQTIDTYGSYDKDGKPVFDKFSNQILDSLNYPIINTGSFYKETYAVDNFSFKDYFAALNESVPDYKALFKDMKSGLQVSSDKLSSKYQDITKALRKGAENSLGIVDNYVSVKLPHTSWFSPVEFENKTQALSQVAMSTITKPVVIKPTTEIVILGANYIEQPVVLESIPVLMPVNYYNQSYYFKDIVCKNVSSSFHLFDFLKKSVFINVQTNDEVNFLFESIQIGSKVYNNAQCFVAKKRGNDLFTGFTYQDEQGRVIEHSWQASSIKGKKDFKLNDLSPNAKVLDQKQWNTHFDQMKNKVEESLAPSLKKDFIQKLSQKVGKKKVLVLKSLDDLSAQLDKNNVTSDDLDSIVSLLKVSLIDPDNHEKIESVVTSLIDKHIFNPTNISKLIPVFQEGFSSSIDSVRSESYSLIKLLINIKEINTQNWSDLVPLLKDLIKSSDAKIVNFGHEIVADLLSASLIKPKNESIAEFKEKFYKNALTDKLLDNLESYNDALLNTISISSARKSLKDFKNQLFSDDTSMNIENIDKFITSKVVTFNDISGLLQAAVDSQDSIVVRKSINFLNGLSESKMIPTNDVPLVLSMVEKGISSSDKNVVSKSIDVLKNLSASKMIPTNDVPLVLSMIEKGISSSDQDIIRQSLDVFNNLLTSKLIQKDYVGEFLKILQNIIKFSNISGKLVTIINGLFEHNYIDKDNVATVISIIENVMNNKFVLNRDIDSAIRNLFKYKLIDGNNSLKILSLIQIANSDNLDTEMRFLENLNERKLIDNNSLEVVLPIVEKGISFNNATTVSNSINLFRNLFVQITKNNIPMFLPIIEKGFSSNNATLVNTSFNLLKDLFTKDLIDSTNVFLVLPLLKKGINNSSIASQSIDLIKNLFEKKFIDTKKALSIFEQNIVNNKTFNSSLDFIQDLFASKLIDSTNASLVVSILKNGIKIGIYSDEKYIDIFNDLLKNDLLKIEDVDIVDSFFENIRLPSYNENIKNSRINSLVELVNELRLKELLTKENGTSVFDFIEKNKNENAQLLNIYNDLVKDQLIIKQEPVKQPVFDDSGSDFDDSDSGFDDESDFDDEAWGFSSSVSPQPKKLIDNEKLSKNDDDFDDDEISKPAPVTNTKEILKNNVNIAKSKRQENVLASFDDFEDEPEAAVKTEEILKNNANVAKSKPQENVLASFDDFDDEDDEMSVKNKEQERLNQLHNQRVSLEQRRKLEEEKARYVNPEERRVLIK